MASKQVIETNKLKIGSGASKGLFVGDTESKYAVITDSAGTPEVIYDKVTYDFTVNDLAEVVPASGGTYNITAAVSTRTHGNGNVDNVAFSPTSITIPANSGDIYTSAITVTQTTSNLTDQFNFTVTGEVVTRIVLNLGTPSVIPASGGSVSSAATSATVYYSSGREETAFTPTKVVFNTVTASSKDITVSDVTIAGQLGGYIEYEGVRSNTAMVTVFQEANAVTASGCTPIVVTSPSGYIGEIPASGGTKAPTITYTGGVPWSSYTSTVSAQTNSVVTFSASMSEGNGFSIDTGGTISAGTKGTTASNQTTSNTATLTFSASANGQVRTATTTYHATQEANYVVSITATGTSSGKHFYYANIPASATSANITGARAGKYRFTSGAESGNWTSSNISSIGSITTVNTFTLSGTQNGFSAVNSTSGTLTAASRGTEIGNARESGIVTGTYYIVFTHNSTYSAGGVVTSSTYQSTNTCTQEGNYVTGITLTDAETTYNTFPAIGGVAGDIGSDGTLVYHFSSKATATTTPSSTYGTSGMSKTYSMSTSGTFVGINTDTGEVTVDSKGTNISNQTTSEDISKSMLFYWQPTEGYNGYGNVSYPVTVVGNAKQAGNYVTSFTVSNVALTYPSGNIPASGGTKSPSGSNGIITYKYSSTSTGTTTPDSEYGRLSTEVTYTMDAGNGFTINSTSGVVTAESRTTTIGDARTSPSIAKTVTCNFAHSYDYDDGGLVLAGNAATATVTQDANAITGYTDYQNPTGVSIDASKVPASGGTSTITFSPAKANQQAKAVYTSNATASSYTTLEVNYTTSVSGNTAVASKGTAISNETTAIATVTGTYTANGKSSTTTTAVKQLGNYVTGITMSAPAFSIETIAASGGTKTENGSNGTVTYAFSSTATSTTMPGKSYGTLTIAKNYTMTSGSGFSVKNASTGEITATTKGTTISNITSSNTITKEITYTWTPSVFYDDAGTKTVNGSTTGKATQAANYVSSVDVAGVGVAYEQIAAAGGTKTPTGSNGTYTFNYTSGGNTSTAPATTYGSSSVTVSYSMTSGGGFTITSISTGEVSADTRGTTTDSERSSNTITKTVTLTWTPTAGYPGGTKSNSGSNTTKATQAANAITGYTDYQSPSGLTISSSVVPASGGTSTISWSPSNLAGTQKAKAVYTSNATASSYTTLNVTCTTGITGNSSVSSKGTTISNATTAIATVTGTYAANGKSATTTCSVTQAANLVVSATATTSSGNNHISYANVGPAATSAPVTKSGAVTLTFSSNSTAKTTSDITGVSIAWNRTYNLASSQNGFTAVNSSTGALTCTSLGTTISNARTSANVTSVLTPVITHTATYGGSVVSATSLTSVVTCTQNGNYVTGLTVSNDGLSYTTIPASGGTSTPTKPLVLVTYHYTSGANNMTTPPTSAGTITVTDTVSSAGTSTMFTLVSTSTGEVSAGTKGTTISEVTSSGTLTLTTNATFVHKGNFANAGGIVEGSGSTTAVCKQALNAITAVGFNTDPALAYSATIAASGGTTSPSGTDGTVKCTYSSTSTGNTFPSSTYGTSGQTVTYSLASTSNGFSLVNVDTGVISADTKGTSVSDITSSDTVTKNVTFTWTPNGTYPGAGAKSGSKSATSNAKQAANTESITWNNPTVSLSYPVGNIDASGGTISPSVSATQTGTASYTSNASQSTTNTSFNYSYSMTSGNGFTINTGTGVVTAEHRSTILGNVRQSNTITVTATGAGDKTATDTDYATQAGNFVTSIEPLASSGSSHFTYNNIAASATSAAIVTQGTARYRFSSGSVYTDPDTSPSFGGTATYTRSNFTLSTAKNGFTSVNSTSGALTATARGIDIGNARESGIVTGRLVVTYKHPTGISGGNITSSSFDTQATCTQEGNYVTAITVTGVVVAYEQIDASGGTASDYGSNGNVRFYYSSTSNSTDIPSSTYGTLSTSLSYVLTAGNGFALEDSSTGEVTADTRGTVSGGTRSSNTITEYATHTWTPTPAYNAAGTVSDTGTGSGKASQQGNTLGTALSNSGTSAYTASVSIGNGMVASGGTATVVHSAGHDIYGYRTYTSGAQVATAYTVSDSSTISIMSNGNNRFSLNGNTLTHSNMTTNETTDTVIVKATNSSRTSATDTASKSIVNEVTSTTWGNVSISDFSYNTSISAGGGKVSPSVTATQSGTNYYTSGSNAVTSNNSFTTSYSYTASGRFKRPSGYSTTGEVSATTRSAEIGLAETGPTVTLTVTGAGGKQKTATAAPTQQGNYVTSIVASAGTCSYPTVAASGGTVSENGSNGKISEYHFTSGAVSASKPNGGTTSQTFSYSMTSGNGFALVAANTGQVTADTRGYEYSTTQRTSNQITETSILKFKHNPEYGGEEVTDSYTVYGTCKQAANTTSTTYSTPSLQFSYEVIPASGGVQVPTKTATVEKITTYASGEESSTTVSLSYSFGMTDSGRWNLRSTSIGSVSATSRGTTIGNADTSPEITMYAWGGGMTGTASTTGNATQAGNYVTNVTASTNCTFSGVIPASGGSITESGNDADISRYKFTSGSYSTEKPSSDYGTVSGETSWSMVNGNGFSLSNSFIVTAGNRGTSTGGTRTSNTITETARAWWIHDSAYSAGGTVSAQTSDTGYCVQAGNYQEVTYGNITVTSPSGNLGEIPASGGYIDPEFSATQSCSSAYTSGAGSASWTENVTNKSFNKSAGDSLGSGFTFKSASTGRISAESRTTITGGSRTSSSVTVTFSAHSKSATATYYVTQQANAAEAIYGDITITSPSGNLGTISASGGTLTPTLSATQTCTSGYTSGSGIRTWTNTSGFSWTFNKSAGNSLGVGFTFKDATTGQISANSRSSSVGSERTSNTVTVTASLNGKSASETYYVTQEANARYTNYGDVIITSPIGNIGTIPASGGTITPTRTATQACESGYTSGYGVSAWTYNVTTWSFNYSSGDAIGAGFYFKSGVIGQLSAENRTTVTGASRTSLNVTITATAHEKTASSTYCVSQEANEMTGSYGNITLSPSITNGTSLYTFPASGGTQQISSIVTASQTVTEQYTSGAGGGTSTTTLEPSSASMTASNGFKVYTSSNKYTVSAETRGTTTGNTRTSNTLSITWSGQGGKSTTRSVYLSQAANQVESISAVSATLTLDYANIPMSGGTSNPYFTSNSGTLYPVFTSGAKGTGVLPGSCDKLYSTTSSTFNVNSTSGIVSKSGYNYTGYNSDATINLALSLCGITWTTKTATIIHPFASVNVEVRSSRSSYKWRYYGAILSNSGSGEEVTSDFTAFEPEVVAIPTSALTANLMGGTWEAGGGSGTISGNPYVTFNVNGSSVGGMYYGTKQNSTSALFNISISPTITVHPGDTIIATFSEP